ncbi:MAG TPA: hypothetical protein VNA20_16505 [Frankiaceae bacterium]|nr:hypothetical protein [Frankiaceae bacterium]
MSIRTTLAATVLAVGVVAVAATPAAATTLTYEKEHTVTPSSDGARVDFGVAVEADTPVGVYGACATDKAVWAGLTGGAGVEGGATGLNC